MPEEAKSARKGNDSVKQEDNDTKEEVIDEKEDNEVKKEDSADEKEASKEDKDKKEKKGLTGKHVALILGILLILAAAAIIIVYLLTRETAEIPDEHVPIGFVVTEENVMNIRDMVQEQIDRGMFTTFMTTTWTFPDGNSPSTDAVMGNSVANQFPYWFTVTLYGTDEIVFTSGLIPVGAQIAEIKLDTPLPAGTYEAAIDINMIDHDGIPVENNLTIGIMLVVQN